MIKDLPEGVLEPPVPFKPNATDPETQFGKGSPATVGTDNLPKSSGNEARTSTFRTSAFSGTLFANFKAYDSGTVNGI